MIFAILAQVVISAVISIGLNLIAQKLAKKDQPKQQSGSVLEVEYGDDTPRYVAIGTCCIAGKAVYDNTFGKSNRTLQRVYKLSDFYTTSLLRVAINGEWYNLDTSNEHADYGFPINDNAYRDFVFVKYYDGWQTDADSALTDNDNPNGRWTSNHKGIGCSYVIVTLIYHSEDFNQIPDFLFEFQGAPLYDFRKDSTASGGAGSHRFNDPSTWEFSENPILADYCYRRGFYVGNDIFCGMGMPASDLPLSRYTAAANACDEDVSGEARYRISILLDATRAHGDNIEDLMVSCAGQVVDSPGGSYPIVGKAQTPVATLSDDDLIVGEAQSFQRYRSMGEIVNSVSGTYTEPRFVYAATGYDQITTSAAQLLDRRTIDFQLDLPMVTSKRQAEQLATIYFNENRFQCLKTVTVQEKWQVLETGDWITWALDRDGTANRVYQIVAMTVRSLDNAPQRHVDLTLQERSADIYDAIGTVTDPIPPTPMAAPEYDQELANFTVLSTQVTSDEGASYPAIFVSWAAPDDETVTHVLIQWRVKDSTDINDRLVHRSISQIILTDGIVGNTVYEVRHRLITDPPRGTVASAWHEVTTSGPPQIVLSNIAADLLETLTRIREDLDRLMTDVPVGFAEGTIAAEQEYVSRQSLKVQADGISAAVVEEQTARIEGDGALASSILAVQAAVEGATATGLFKVEATAAPDDAEVRLALYGRIDTESDYEEAGIFIDLIDEGGGNISSRIVLSADRTVIADTMGDILALFDESGQIELARVPTITSEKIANEVLAIGADGNFEIFRESGGPDQEWTPTKRSLVQIIAVGPAGGIGTHENAPNIDAAVGGSGAGGFCMKTVILEAGDTLTINVGAHGGMPSVGEGEGQANGLPASGPTTVVSDSMIVNMIANEGEPGEIRTTTGTAAGGAGGTASGGDVNWTGGNGGDAVFTSVGTNTFRMGNGGAVGLTQNGGHGGTCDSGTGGQWVSGRGGHLGNAIPGTLNSGSLNVIYGPGLQFVNFAGFTMFDSYSFWVDNVVTGDKFGSGNRWGDISGDGVVIVRWKELED